MMLVAGMTAFYMFRLYYKIFWWNNPDYGHHTPHDAPMTMSLPLIILSVVSILAGLIPFGEFVSWNREAYHIHLNYTVAISSVAVAVVAILLATKLYLKENEAPAKMAKSFKGLWTAAYNRFYMDELYQFITHKIIFERVSRPLAWFDRQIVDGSLNSLANLANSASFAIRKLQSGSIQSYVYVYLIGVLLLAAITVICLI